MPNFPLKVQNSVLVCIRQLCKIEHSTREELLRSEFFEHLLPKVAQQNIEIDEDLQRNIQDEQLDILRLVASLCPTPDAFDWSRIFSGFTQIALARDNPEVLLEAAGICKYPSSAEWDNLLAQYPSWTERLCYELSKLKPEEVEHGHVVLTERLLIPNTDLPRSYLSHARRVLALGLASPDETLCTRVFQVLEQLRKDRPSTLLVLAAGAEGATLLTHLLRVQKLPQLYLQNLGLMSFILMNDCGDVS